MTGSYRIVCSDCGHSAAVDRAPRATGIWRCGECGGPGAVASETLCHGCGTPIPAARIAALPQTRHCVHCADSMAARPARFDEPLGSREDFKRDRSSWRR